MRLCGFLTPAEIETIHGNALRILTEIGVRVEHETVRRRLASVGGRCEDGSDVVHFGGGEVERLISEAKKQPPRDQPPSVSAGVHVSQARYLDPSTNELVPFDEERLARYFGLAGRLESVRSASMMGMPFAPTGIEQELLPLAEKLYAWKLGIRASGSVIFTWLCGPLLEMFECHAAHSGEDLGGVFQAQAFLVSPLDLPRPVCEQFLFFAERGLRLTLGNMPSLGGSAPVTLAGAASLSLAEQMFLYLVARSFWSDYPFVLRGNIVAIDMRTGSPSTSPPAARRLNLALADIARFYGCKYHSQSGATDAKLPSYEAGVQKAMGALLSALASGHGSVNAGQLSTGDVHSPVQMVLDADLAGALRSLCRDAGVDETECAIEEVRAAGIGGHHLDTAFTAERFRKELYLPRTWSSGSVNAWAADGREVDLDKAREIVRAHDRDFEPMSRISAEEERDLRAIIGRAGDGE